MKNLARYKLTWFFDAFGVECVCVCVGQNADTAEGGASSSGPMLRITE